MGIGRQRSEWGGSSVVTLFHPLKRHRFWRINV
jgi:hypothetical protein